MAPATVATMANRDSRLIAADIAASSKPFIAMDGMYAGFAGALTGLYQIVDKYYPAFTAHLAAPGKDLPGSDPADQFGDTVDKVAGFSLHAGAAVKPTNATSWSGCADTSQDRRCRKSACR